MQNKCNAEIHEIKETYFMSQILQTTRNLKALWQTFKTITENEEREITVVINQFKGLSCYDSWENCKHLYWLLFFLGKLLNLMPLQDEKNGE